MLKKASQAPQTLPTGKKVLGKWQWKREDVQLWIDTQARRDITGESPLFGSVILSTVSPQLSPVSDKLGFYHRLRVKTVSALTGISVSCVWKNVRNGKLPPPLKDGAVTYWLAGELAEALERSTLLHRQQRSLPL